MDAHVSKCSLTAANHLIAIEMSFIANIEWKTIRKNWKEARLVKL